MINPITLRDVLSRTLSVMREQNDDNGEPIASGNPELFAELVAIVAGLSDPLTAREQVAISRARTDYVTDDIEIDASPAVSSNDEGGVWVAAWVYVGADELDDAVADTIDPYGRL